MQTIYKSVNGKKAKYQSNIPGIIGENRKKKKIYLKANYYFTSENCYSFSDYLSIRKTT